MITQTYQLNFFLGYCNEYSPHKRHNSQPPLASFLVRAAKALYDTGVLATIPQMQSHRDRKQH